MRRLRTATVLGTLVAMTVLTLPGAQAVSTTVAPTPQASSAAAVSAVTLPSALPAATVWTPIPSYAVAAHDEPITYSNGCHAWRAVVTPRLCTIVNPTAQRRVLLFGDSHAAHWYSAVLASAKAHGWRMFYLTKSSCPATDVSVKVYKQTASYPQCPAWRHRVFTALAHNAWGKVDVTVVSNWNFHQVVSASGRRLTGAALTAAWEAGMRRTLTALLRSSRQVVLLRDSPDLPGDASQARACFARWRQAAQTRCGAPKSRALNSALWAAEARAAASFPGRVQRVDLTTGVCPASWCGPIDGRYLRFKDDNHWTQTYMLAHFAPLVDTLLVPAMRRANPVAVAPAPALRAASAR